MTRTPRPVPLRLLRRLVALSLFIAGTTAVVSLPVTDALAAPNCGGSSTGRTPLMDSIGLYESGNAVPGSHAAVAPDIVPIRGVVGLVALGMSNADREFNAFIGNMRNEPAIDPSVRIVNGAVGGKTMSAWADPTDGVWDTSLARITSSGITPDQVQVIWMKMGSQLGELGGSTSERVEQERGWLTATMENARGVFPNLQRVYLSSRIYAGYNSSPNHNEPETGFDNGLSVRATVADAVAGDTAVWAAWGPYLWADGVAARSDGLTWECTDFADDGVHPSILGEQKVANLLATFFSSDATACGWFLADPTGCGTALPPPTCGMSRCDESRFVDVPATHLFFADIEWLADEGITLGCNPPDNTRYCPDAEVTRGQMAAFLDRALDLPDGPDAFSDDDGSVFEGNINALSAAGVTKGCNPPGNDRYCPDAFVTRGQMAAFLTRALNLPGGGGDTFVDDDGSIFENDVEALAASGITKGCNPPTNDRFCPDSFVTRAQMAAFLHRAAPLLDQ